MTLHVALAGAKVELGDEALDVIAARVAEHLATLTPPAPEPWIGAREAAEHIGAPVSRIHALVHQRRLRHRKDGARLVFRRSDLDAYLEGGDQA